MRPLTLVAALFAVPVVAQPPTAPYPRVVLTPALRERLKERDRLARDATDLEKAAKLKQAIETGEKLLAIEREVYGPVHENLARSLVWMGQWKLRIGDWAGARAACRERAEVRKALHDQDDWRVIDARQALADVDLFEKMTPNDWAAVQKATDLHDDASRLYGQDKYAEACAKYLDALGVRTRLLGDTHPDTLRCKSNLSLVYRAQSRDKDAEPLIKEVLFERRKALGDAHPDTLTSINILAGLYRDQGRDSDAEKSYKEALAGRRKALGDTHADTLRSMTSLAGLYRQQARYADAEPLFQEALAGRPLNGRHSHTDTLRTASNLALMYQDQRRYAEAQRLFQEVLYCRRITLGDTHADTLRTISNLAHSHQGQGHYSDAEKLYVEALAGCRKALGNTHADTLKSLYDLAALYQLKARSADAEKLYVEALAGQRKVLGDTHADTLRTMNGLASLQQALGRYADAEPLYKEALAGRRKTLGDTHAATLRSVTDLATLYHLQGRDADAELLHRDTVNKCRKGLGDAHVTTLRSVNDLAALYLEQGRYTDAEPLIREALAGRRKALGEAHFDTLVSTNHLAVLYRAQGRDKDAELLFEQVASEYLKLGSDHPDALTALHNLATVRRSPPEDAEHWFKVALAGRRKVLGDAHPDTLTTLQSLADLYREQGKYALAGPLDKQALVGTRVLLDRTAVGQAEQQQLAFRGKLRHRLDAFLSSGVAAGRPAADRYAEVLAWKGSAFARRAQLRAAVERAADPALTRLFAEAGEVNRRLSNLASATPPADQLAAYRKTLQELADRKDEIDQELARKSEPFRQARETATLTPDQLAKALPADVALIDYLEYGHVAVDPEKKGALKFERRLLAYVVRNGKPVVEVELGAAQPVAEAVDQWRETLGRATPVRDAKDPAAILRAKVWVPVVKHLGDAKVILLSPDGALGRLPFGALPGTDPKKYLIEETTLVVAPVPQIIPEALADARKPAKDPGLLVVGDVDYDAEPGKPGTAGRAAERAGSAGKWSRLPGTKVEAGAIRELFGARFPQGTATALGGDGATESTVRAGAPKSRYLHVATHGFFAPPKLAPAADRGRTDASSGDSRATDVHPGLQSGLVLAGANRPPKAGLDDGVLTALEVSDLDLTGVELAVLSACETRLGKEVGGEGTLGLERAFQAAGARSTVTSLWKVPDRATQVLMVRFYRNLWDKKMSKLDALREAQLWTLTEGLNDADIRRDRGATADLPAAEVEKGGRLPPYFWAAFTLAGDWR